MREHINENKTVNFAKTTVVMTIVAIFVKLLGFGRDLVLANSYGASNVSDAFLIAFSIPSVLFSVIGKSISTCLVPIYNDCEKKEPGSGNNFISKFAIYCLALSLILIAIICFFPNLIIKIFASNFDENTAEICKNILLIGCFSLLFMVLTGIFVSFAQIKKHYIITTIISLPLNIILIISVFISLKTSYLVLGFGILLAYVSELLLLMPVIIKEKFKFKFSVSFDENIKNSLLLILPLLIGSCASQVNHIIDKSVASNFGTGGVSILSYASTISVSIQELFITGLLSIIFVEFSSLFSKGNQDEIKNKSSEIIFAVIKVLIPITVFCFLFSNQIADFVFLFKHDTSHDTKIYLAECISFYSLGIIFVAVRDIYVKLFYVYKNTFIPNITTLISVSINVVLNILLFKLLGLKGIAIATTISSFASMMFLIVFFNAKYFKITIMNNVLKILVICFVCLASGVGVFFLQKVIHTNPFLILLISFTLFIGFTYFLLRIFKIDIIDFIKKKGGSK